MNAGSGGGEAGSSRVPANAAGTGEPRRPKKKKAKAPVRPSTGPIPAPYLALAPQPVSNISRTTLDHFSAPSDPRLVLPSSYLRAKSTPNLHDAAASAARAAAPRRGYASKLAAPPLIVPGGTSATPRIQDVGVPATRRRGDGRRRSEEGLRAMALANQSMASLGVLGRIMENDSGQPPAEPATPPQRRRRRVVRDETDSPQRQQAMTREEGRAIGLARGASMRRLNVWDDLPDPGDAPPPFPFPTTSTARQPPNFNARQSAVEQPPSPTEDPAPPFEARSRSPPPTWEQAMGMAPSPAPPNPRQPEPGPGTGPPTSESDIILAPDTPARPHSIRSPAPSSPETHYASAPESPSHSSSEGGVEEESEERRLWLADIAAGYTLTDRVEREARRRAERELPSTDADPRAAAGSGLEADAPPGLGQGQVGSPTVIDLNDDAEARVDAGRPSSALASVADGRVESSLEPTAEVPVGTANTEEERQGGTAVAAQVQTADVEPEAQTASPTMARPTAPYDTHAKNSVETQGTHRGPGPSSHSAIATSGGEPVGIASKSSRPTASGSSGSTELLKGKKPIRRTQDVISLPAGEKRAVPVIKAKPNAAAIAQETKGIPTEHTAEPEFPNEKRKKPKKPKQRVLAPVVQGLNPSAAVSKAQSDEPNPAVPSRFIEASSSANASPRPILAVSVSDRPRPLVDGSPTIAGAPARSKFAESPVVGTVAGLAPVAESVRDTASAAGSDLPVVPPPTRKLTRGKAIRRSSSGLDLSPDSPSRKRSTQAESPRQPLFSEGQSTWRPAESITVTGTDSPPRMAPMHRASTSSIPTLRTTHLTSPVLPSFPRSGRTLGSLAQLESAPPVSPPLQSPVSPSMLPHREAALRRRELVAKSPELPSPIAERSVFHPMPLVNLADRHPPIPYQSPPPAVSRDLLQLFGEDEPVAESSAQAAARIEQEQILAAIKKEWRIDDEQEELEDEPPTPPAKTPGQRAPPPPPPLRRVLISTTAGANLTPRRSIIRTADSPVTPRPLRQMSVGSADRPSVIPTRRPAPPPPIPGKTEEDLEEAAPPLPPRPAPSYRPAVLRHQSSHSVAETASSLSEQQTPVPTFEDKTGSPVRRPKGPRPPPPPRPWPRYVLPLRDIKSPLRPPSERTQSDTAVSQTGTVHPRQASRRSTSEHDVRASAGPQSPLEYTDLDVLVSRLEGSGREYEGFSQITAFLGPGKSLAATPEALATLLPGLISVDSRRVTPQGKVKLKLSLLGVRVSKCPICLGQFKQDEQAVLLPECGHISHEECASKWFREDHRCFVCRVALLPEGAAGRGSQVINDSEGDGRLAEGVI